MIIRRKELVEEFDIEKVTGIEGVKLSVKWMISSEVGGDEYGHQFALRYFTMQPGGVYPLHRHHYVEAVFLISGELEFAAEDGGWQKVGPGDVVYTSRWENHQLRNPGRQPAIFTCTIDCDKQGEPCLPPRR